MDAVRGVSMLAIALLVGSLPAPAGAALIGVSIPVNSTENQTYALAEGVWSVGAPPYPLDTHSGIGWIVDPAAVLPGSNYSMHNHVYDSPNVPAAGRSTVTYKFDVATAVGAVKLIQHHNGITQVEGFYGDDLNSMTSIGKVFGTDGDLTGVSQFTELEPYSFDFASIGAGIYFQLRFTKTSLSDGYAVYRTYLYDESGEFIAPAPGVSVVASPGTAALGVLALLVTVNARRRLLLGKARRRVALGCAA